MRNRTHAPTAKSARPATRFAPATRYIGPQHNPGAKVDTFVRDACKCSRRRDACFESTSRPANARREHTAAGNAPQHPPSTGRMLATPDSRVGRAGRDNHLSCWYGKRIPCKRVSSGKRTQAVPKLEEGFVGKRTACMRGFRQERMHEGVSSGPHAGEGFVAEYHDSNWGALNKQAAVALGHRLKGAHARRRGCSPRRAPW